jgi:hypothetical protein
MGCRFILLFGELRACPAEQKNAISALEPGGKKLPLNPCWSITKKGGKQTATTIRVN